MKRRTPRQMVRMLSDIRHAQRCTALRAAAASRALDAVLNDDDPDDEAARAADAAEQDAQDSRELRFDGLRWNKP